KAQVLNVLIAALLAPVAAHAFSDRVPLYRYVSEDRPVVVMNSAPTYVESLDVNWRGATGYTNVRAEVLADGQLVWSGLIPAYDPTFYTAIRARVSTIELRVDRGSAYVNWAMIYAQAGAPANGATTPEFSGNLTSASELARDLIFTL